MNQYDNTESRRRFIQKASMAAFAFPLIPLGISSLIGCAKSSAGMGEDDELKLVRANANRSPDCEWCGAKDAPEKLSWQTVIAGPNEEGAPLIISGAVFLSDGKTPAPNILVYVYHTNPQGYYRTKPEEHRHGKFRGWMLTDEKGRYEFRAIKPASYPNTTIPAHIHVTVTGKDFPERTADTIEFAGDSHITEEKKQRAARKGKFSPLIELKKDEKGVLRGAYNIKLEV
jgi:protocatechuate 3,4-dioxygenase beta subunit